MTAEIKQERRRLSTLKRDSDELLFPEPVIFTWIKVHPSLPWMLMSIEVDANG